MVCTFIRKKAKNSWLWKNSCRSTVKSRRTKMSEPLKIWWKVWKYTTRWKMDACWAPNWLTFFSSSVSFARFDRCYNSKTLKNGSTSVCCFRFFRRPIKRCSTFSSTLNAAFWLSANILPRLLLVSVRCLKCFSGILWYTPTHTFSNFFRFFFWLRRFISEQITVTLICSHFIRVFFSFLWCGARFAGEKLEDPQVEEIMKACAGPEDEDGFIKYESKLFALRSFIANYKLTNSAFIFTAFVKNVFAGPFPEEAK